MTDPVEIANPATYARPQLKFVGSPPSARVIVTFRTPPSARVTCPD